MCSNAFSFQMVACVALGDLPVEGCVLLPQVENVVQPGESLRVAPLLEINLSHRPVDFRVAVVHVQRYLAVEPGQGMVSGVAEPDAVRQKLIDVLAGDGPGSLDLLGEPFLELLPRPLLRKRPTR